MKRTVLAAFLLLAALGSRAEARSLPKPARLVNRQVAGHVTHYVRGTRPVPEAPRPYLRRAGQRPGNLTHGVRQ